MKFEKLVIPKRSSDAEVPQLSEAEWEEAHRQTVQAMIAEYGEAATRRFLARYEADNPPVTVRPPTVPPTTVDARPDDYAVE